MIKATATKSNLIIKPFENREIKYAFHDIDGTHSLIREWPPVMSICLYYVIKNGLPKDFDSKENEEYLISIAGKEPHPETDKFCVESAGLSALTQMEWAIRRSIEENVIDIKCDKKINSEIIKQIWDGKENFDSYNESAEIKEFIKIKTPVLFKLYERVLNGYCRDKNLALAKINPERFLVPGSMEFLKYLHDNGVKNYFVTGAVVEKGMGMYEEVESLGFEIGEGQIIEDIIGSTWTEKMPKDSVMNKLLNTLNISGKEVLVVGDGRAEISAGVKMDALTISCLPPDANIQRELHNKLGTNIIVSDYKNKELFSILNIQK